MKKILRLGFLAMLIMAIMTLAAACAPAEKETVDPADEEVQGEVQEPSDTDEPSTDGQAKDDADEPTDTDKPATNEEPAEVKEPAAGNEPVGGDEEDANEQTVKGTFGGLADPHTFELKTNEVPEGVMAFQFYDEEIGAKLANMEEGQELTVVYTTNEHGQNLVKSIK
ncbi:hypothetical protein [Niallia oryzisoli]|uniref:hypothetical protein n=1 Tax=Niallia oryzisoli TaxID=1737571 RepID=UPI003736D7DD